MTSFLLPAPFIIPATASSQIKRNADLISTIHVNDMPINGDVKVSLLPGDHDNWFLLDGRLVSTLPTEAQTAATLLGFSTNLPDATEAVIGNNSGETVGTVTGTNTVTLSQANLPNVTLTATTTDNGSHTHENSSETHLNSYIARDDNATGRLRSTSASGDLYNVRSRLMAADGVHSHTVNTPLGGSEAPLSVKQRTLNVNTFVWLEI